MSARRGRGGAQGGGRRVATTACLTLAGLTGIGAESALAQEGRAWRPDERIILTSYHLVSGVTRDERRIYAASEGGLQIVDLFAERWERPSTAEDGYPVAEGPTAVAYDPVERVVWLGTAAGALHAFQVDFERWRLESSPGVGPVLALVPFSDGLDDGVYVRTPTGWYRIVRSGAWLDPVPPGRLPPDARRRELSADERLARIEPAFGAVAPTLTVDRSGRRWPVTDFVAGDRPSRYWIGTAGNGLYHYDARFFEAESRWFGLLTPGAGAMAADPSGLWIGGDGRGPRRGPVHASWDLQEWRRFESGIEAAPSERIEDALVTPTAVWFGASSGLYRLDRQSHQWLQVGGAVGRLPVRRMTPTDEGLWVATDRGLLLVTEAGAIVRSFFDGRAVHAVVEDTGGTVWVGGPAGLVRMDHEGHVNAVPAGEPPPPPGPIVDLVRDEGALWAATPDALWHHDGRSWEGPLREAPSLVGPVRRLRLTGGALWTTGDGGAARRVRDGSGWTYLLLDRDLPSGPVFDIVVTDDHVHAATPAGVVRLDRRRGY